MALFADGLLAQGLIGGLLIGTTALFTLLSVLNLRYGADQIASHVDWLTTELDIDEPLEVLAYERATTVLNLAQTWTVLLVLLTGLYTGAFGAIIRALQTTTMPVVAQAIVFISALVIGYRLLTAPFDLISTFYIDEAFEFNTTTPSLWMRDFLLQTGIIAVFAGLLFGVLALLIASVPTVVWVVGGWALVVGLGVAMQVIYPRVIAPLFNDFEPIDDPDLQTGIEELFDQVGFKAEGIYRMDASRRSTRLNAYFIGFGQSKRVVLFDTLIEELNREQILSVLAHELGHWTQGHIWKRLGASAVQTGVAFAVFGAVVETTAISQAFAVPATVGYGQLFIAMLVGYPLLELTAPVVNRVSLAHEREADRFAVDAMADSTPMVNALASLARENLANPFPHPWYAAFTQTHPPIPERIRMLQEYDPQQS